LLNLYDIVERLQDGDAEAGWQFSEHPKIKAIIRSRIKTYRRQFYWLPAEDFEDVEHWLRPKLIELAAKFGLPEQRNEGRIVTYFKMRIMGEADFLLKKITGMRQVSDKDGNLYLKSFAQNLDDLGDVECDVEVDSLVISDIEDSRQNRILKVLFEATPDISNDRIWLQAYVLRLQKKSWSEVAAAIGYQQRDYAWLKDNTARFVSRLKHRLVVMGENINCRICGIYTDASDVGICVIDTVDPKKFLIWSKNYESYVDLDKVEGKLGDIFRQFDITYVVMNEVWRDNRASVICMRYLSKREAFVEMVDALPFFRAMVEWPEKVREYTVNDVQRRAYQLAEIKKAHLGCIRDRGRESGHHPTH